MAGFIVGLLVSGFIGVYVMCLCQVAGKFDSDKE